jgi:hypothetical protein
MNFLKNTVVGQVISGEKKIIFNAGYESSMEYANPRKNISPKIQLLFSPFGLPFVPIEIISNDVNKILTNFNWTKDRTNPGGILSFSIAPNTQILKDIVSTLNKYSFNLYSKIWGSLGVDFEDLFKPMTLCQLWIDGYHVMTGYVRSCHRSASIDKESKNVSYDVVIEELGNIYNQPTTSLDLILLDGMQRQIQDSMQKALSLTANLIGVNIATGLKAMLNAFIATNLTEYVTLSDGFPLSFRLLALPNPIGGIANLSLASYIFSILLVIYSGIDS